MAVRVEVKNLVKIFPAYGSQGEFRAVNDVSLNVEPGEMVTLLGPSGCGKTTILRMIAGFEIPTTGSILIDGREVSKLPPNKRNVGMMFQSYALFPHLSVFENVAYGLRLKKLPTNVIREKVRDVLELMQISQFVDRMPNQISGGQQQRVALARAVVTEPSVLLFDEPLSNLDAKLREYMRDELRKIQQRVGITSIYVTHDQSEAMAISDRVVVMNAGKIEQIGTATGIYTEPENPFVANFMGKANFVGAEGVALSGGEAEANVLGERLRMKANGACESAARHLVLLRPECVQLDENGKFSARIVSAVYMGQHVQYELEIAGECITAFDFLYHRHGYHRPGEEVRVSLIESSLRLLPDDRREEA